MGGRERKSERKREKERKRKRKSESESESEPAPQEIVRMGGVWSTLFFLAVAEQAKPARMMSHKSSIMNVHVTALRCRRTLRRAERTLHMNTGVARCQHSARLHLGHPG